MYLAFKIIWAISVHQTKKRISINFVLLHLSASVQPKVGVGTPWEVGVSVHRPLTRYLDVHLQAWCEPVRGITNYQTNPTPSPRRCMTTSNSL